MATVAKAVAALGATVVVALLAEVSLEHWRFERRLSALQELCNKTPTGTARAAVESRVRAMVTTASTAVRWTDDPSRQSLVVYDSSADGWVCELVFERERVVEHAFGADHGARHSLLDRSKP